MNSSLFIQKRKITFSRLNSRLLLVNVVLLGIFFALQIFITSSVGTVSHDIDTIRKEKNELRLKNEIMMAEIDKAKTLNVMKDVESKLGLTHKNVTFLDEGNFNDLAYNK